ncbi:hypothetical protein [Paenibacillus sp. NEAU-GSW1]|uniref:hypothetical protein n=1 Tax=Paenibacillus sp. NEAU-GSW1 TaxID=2682486 RepID=UPI0012E2E2FA|nr:hypothetical protein [Paenibacillus sp. NEAU-GSW1]MUT64615.1 hypothetical protein [Paenibacillus sp. NEAU-GSW1]
MTKKNSYFALVFIIVLTLLTSCAKPVAEEVEQKPAYQEDPSVKILKDEIILYTDTDKAKGIGDLYMKKPNGDREKIAGDVLRGQFTYLYNTKAAVYIDKDHVLHIKEDGKAEEQLGTDVFPDSVFYSGDESTMLFLRTTKPKDYTGTSGDLYRVVKGTEKEKIAGDVSLAQYSLTKDGKVATFLTKDASLYRKAADVTDKEKLGSDVVQFKTSPDGNTTIFSNKEGSVYLKKASAPDKEKLAAENIGEVQFSDDNTLLAYLDEYKKDSSKGELILAKEGYERVKLASDVTDYEFTSLGDYIYFLNEDKSLYMKILTDPETDKEPAKKKKKGEPSPSPTVAPLKQLNPAEKVKLGDEVVYFDLSPDGTSIVYLDADDNLFLKRFGEEKVKVASDISEVSLYNQTILMLNKEKSLYSVDLAADSSVSTEPESGADAKTDDAENKEGEAAAPAADKPASPVKEKVMIAEQVVKYAADSSLSYIAYRTKSGEVYTKTAGQEAPVKAIEKAGDYSTIHFLGSMLFEKLVTLDQIAGTWKAVSKYDGESYDWYLEITKDRKFITYDAEGVKHEQDFKFSDPTPSQADIVFTEDSDDMLTLEVIDDNKLVFHYPFQEEETTVNVTRMKKDAFDKAIKDMQAEAEKARQLQAKIDEANDKASQVLYTYLYNYDAGTKVYHTPNGEVAGTLGGYLELFVTDTSVTETGELWCKASVYFSDVYMNMDVWFTYKSVT